MTTILFLHGWMSKPGGLKPSFLIQHGHEVINPALPDEDFDESIRIAQTAFHRHQPEVVFGSSRGGSVAMNINSGSAKFVLPSLEVLGISHEGQTRHRDPSLPNRRDHPVCRV